MPKIKNTLTGFEGVASDADIKSGTYNQTDELGKAIWEITPDTPTPSEPFITRDASKDLIGGSNAINGQVKTLSDTYRTITGGGADTQTTEPLSAVDQAFANLQAAASAKSSAYSAAEDARIKKAGEDAGLQYQSLIDNAKKEKAKGLGISEISAGESGGFMSTQFTGMAAETGITPEQAATMGRYGTGGELSRIKSEYDSNINSLEAKKAAAIAAAEDSMRSFIATGKQSDFDNANDLFEAAKEAAKAKQDAASAMADRLQKQLEYQLELDKFAYTQEKDSNAESLQNKKLDVDIAALTGSWNGQETLAAKSARLKNVYDKLGLDFDKEKFNYEKTQDQITNELNQAKLDLEKSKQDAITNNIDIEQSVKDALNGFGGIEKGQPGYQAFKSALNAVKTIYKDEAESTSNAYYTIKGSAGASGGTLTATQADAVSKIFAVYPQLQNLKGLFDKLKADGKTGAWVGAIKNKDFTDPYVAEFKAALAGIIPTVARGVYGEVGVLTDNDINNYSRAVAKINNPDEASEAIFNNMLNTLETKAASYLKVAANNQKDVSGFASDYENLVDSIRSMNGYPKPAKSTNPVVYDSVADFRAGIGEDAYSNWAETAIDGMMAAGISDANDYFEFLKEVQLNKNIFKDIPVEDTGGEIKPSFNNVGTDTNQGVEDKSLGDLSKKYESGGDPGVIGYDSTGGYSYGTYQLAHDNAKKFIVKSKYADEFNGLEFNSPEWQAKWREIATKDPAGFDSEQHQYIKDKFFEPQINKLEKSGIDLSKRSPVVQDVIWSTAVQHGANTDVITKAYSDAVKLLGREPNDKELIIQIYNERWSNGQRFASSTPAVQESVKNRFITEREQALKSLA